MQEKLLKIIPLLKSRDQTNLDLGIALLQSLGLDITVEQLVKLAPF